ALFAILKPLVSVEISGAVIDLFSPIIRNEGLLLDMAAGYWSYNGDLDRLNIVNIVASSHNITLSTNHRTEFVRLDVERTNEVLSNILEEVLSRPVGHEAELGALAVIRRSLLVLTLYAALLLREPSGDSTGSSGQLTIQHAIGWNR